MSNPKYTYIYALCCPFSGKIRYIGKSNDPKDRLWRHIRESSRGVNHKECWIKGLLKKGVKPELVVLEMVLYEIWEEREMFYIEVIPNLTNILDGGGDSPMLHPEIAKKAANSLRGYKHTEETRKKLSEVRKKEWATGVRKPVEFHTEERKLKAVKRMKKMWKERSQEVKKKIGKNISKSKFKKVVQLTLEGKVVKIWNSATEPALHYKGYKDAVAKRCRKTEGNQEVFGYKWRWLRTDATDTNVVNEINN